MANLSPEDKQRTGLADRRRMDALKRPGHRPRPLVQQHHGHRVGRAERPRAHGGADDEVDHGVYVLFVPTCRRRRVWGEVAPRACGVGAPRRGDLHVRGRLSRRERAPMGIPRRPFLATTSRGEE